MAPQRWWETVAGGRGLAAAELSLFPAHWQHSVYCTSQVVISLVMICIVNSQAELHWIHPLPQALAEKSSVVMICIVYSPAELNCTHLRPQALAEKTGRKKFWLDCDQLDCDGQIVQDGSFLNRSVFSECFVGTISLIIFYNGLHCQISCLGKNTVDKTLCQRNPDRKKDGNLCRM